jgi:hypothetical protein
MNLAGQILELCEMPVLVGPRGRKEVQVLLLDQVLEEYPPPVCVFIEKVGPFPKSSSLGSFTFGRAFEALITWVKLRKYPYELVLPRRWKQLLPGTDHSKAAGLAWVRHFHPHWNPVLKNKDGLADAALIAEWGRRDLLRKHQAA